MIDTIRFRININKNIYKQLSKWSIEQTKTDNIHKQIIFKFFNTEVNLQSYFPNVALFTRDEDTSFLEFSVPKQADGHNIKLLPTKHVLPTIERIYQAIKDKSADFPPIDEWTISRLDLCYVWKLKSQTEAQRILDDLKSILIPRKSKSLGRHHYPTSIFLQGVSYSSKFYLKQPEFKKHDFKRISEHSEEYAYELLNLADGVLRFEITFRKKILQYIFDERILTLKHILSYDLEEILRRYYKKLFKGMSVKSLSTKGVFELLISAYGKTRGADLFQFYNTYVQGDEQNKAFLDSAYNRSTINRNIKALKLAGISAINSKRNIDLSIPSKLSI